MMASSVDFPGFREDAAGLNTTSPVPQRPLHLPFRRISMPTVPSPATLAQLRTANPHLKDHRVSVASQHSLESQPENPNGQRNSAYITPSPISSSSPKPRRSMSRPSSLQPPPRTPTIASSTIAKKKKVLRELLETERTYVDGLELINEHFLAPLVKSAQEPNPLLSPGQMSSIFSNFIDMLGFHQAFYESLNRLIGPAVKPVTQPPSAYAANPPPPPSRGNSLVIQTSLDPPPSIVPLLTQHIPFLAMYTPFVTAYPTIMASLHNLTSPNSASFSPRFATWLKEQEQDPACGRLGLRDWLLTLVQRCPRYLLLVRDLLSCTDPSEADYPELEKIVKQLDNVNISLNSALQTQAITLQLLAVQKATPNLPIPFLEPGRRFIKRGSFFQVADRVERLREFFLFSDCLVWLSKGGEREGAVTAEEFQFKRSMITSPSVSSSITSDRRQGESGPTPLRRPSSTVFGSKISSSSTNLGEDERWWFRGKVDLLDLDIVLPVPSFGEEGKIEVHSPAMSFSIYCDSAEEREDWASAIRAAKQSRLVAMNSTNPNSTLTSSSSNQHLRLALQALPYSPDEATPATPLKKKNPKKDKSKQLPKRGHVEHFVPAIWVPDSKTDSCMRCGGVFGWRRRRHHCRLCGKCVCANCSGKTFFIASKQPSKESSKPARACNACYEAVFPVLEPETPSDIQPSQTNGALPHYSSIGTLTALPFSKSTPSLLLPSAGPVVQPPPLHYELPKPVQRENLGEKERPTSGLDFLPIGRPRMPDSRPPSELRSSSYTTSTMGSVFVSGGDSTMDIPATAESPNSMNSPGPSVMGAARPRHRTTFSTPAVALHTTPVMARASMDADVKGVRYSMVLGNKSRVIGAEFGDEKENSKSNARKSLDAGLAVGKLTNLLARK
ncbi:hypothetical protein FRB91_007858 [Serendipita sp. 411]|nr:hypothetical protein FRB91_007858 [Serendipita sp. 411]